MVLVDSSIWIALYRKKHHELGQKMWSLVVGNQAAICGQIWVEYIGGFRKAKDRAHHAEKLRSFPFLSTSFEAFQLAAELLAKHPHLGAGDATIAATALTHHCSLFTLDKDFLALIPEGLSLFHNPS